MSFRSAPISSHSRDHNRTAGFDATLG